MLRLGTSSPMPFIIIAIALLIVIMFVVLTRLFGPSVVMNTEQESQLLSERAAVAINALSTTEEATFEIEFNSPWNVELYKKSMLCKVPFITDECGYYIKFSYGEVEGETMIIGNLPVEEIKLENLNKLVISKERGTIKLS